MITSGNNANIIMKYTIELMLKQVKIRLKSQMLKRLSLSVF